MFCAGSLWGRRRCQLPLEALLYSEVQSLGLCQPDFGNCLNAPPTPHLRLERGQGRTTSPRALVPNIVIPATNQPPKSVNKS